MKFQVLEDLILKTGKGNIELRKGQTVEVQPEKVTKLVESGKLQPLPVVEELPTGYGLSERMAIMGENCEPDQVKPFVTESGVLVIPFNSHRKYHYWKKGGQGVCETLKELGRCDLIPKYKSFYSN